MANVTPPSPVPIPAPVRSPKEWALDLFGSMELGDPRRKKRLLSVATACMTNPGKSFGQTFPTSDQIKGAYRLMANDHVSAETVSGSIWEAGARACAGHEVIYAVQDTTDLEFTSRKSLSGAGPIGMKAPWGSGFYLHTTLAVRSDGLPLGVLHHHLWARDPEEKGKKKTRKQRPIEEKESFKWIRGMREASAILKRAVPAPRRPRVIHVMDREGDVHEVFEEAMPSGQGLIVRAAQNRSLAEDEKYLWEHMRQRPACGYHTVSVRSRPDRRPRTATLAVRWSHVTLNPDPAKHTDRVPVHIYVVWVKETNPPEGVTPVEWMLLTTEPVHSLEEALEIVEAYRLRWRIEEMHLILKSGCRMEKVQYRSQDRVEKILVLFLASAVRLLMLRYLAETDPDAPCTQVLTPSQEKALRIYVRHQFRKQLTTQITVSQALFWIGRLGGHLGRKSDGRPGVRTLWRGLRDLEVLTTMYEAMHSS